MPEQMIPQLQRLKPRAFPTDEPPRGGEEESETVSSHLQKLKKERRRKKSDLYILNTERQHGPLKMCPGTTTNISSPRDHAKPGKLVQCSVCVHPIITHLLSSRNRKKRLLRIGLFPLRTASSSTANNSTDEVRNRHLSPPGEFARADLAPTSLPLSSTICIPPITTQTFRIPSAPSTFRRHYAPTMPVNEPCTKNNKQIRTWKVHEDQDRDTQLKNPQWA